MIALLASALALAASDPPSLPARGAERLAADPALAARVRDLPARTQSLNWMLGGYDVETRTEGAAYPVRGFGYVQNGFGMGWIQLRETYDHLPEQLTFFGYDPAGRRWQSTTIDHHKNVLILHAPDWENGRAVFEGEVRILGERVYLRRTVTRLTRRGTGGDDEDFTIVEERRIGGRWQIVTTRHFGGRPVN